MHATLIDVYTSISVACIHRQTCLQRYQKMHKNWLRFDRFKVEYKLPRFLWITVYNITEHGGTYCRAYVPVTSEWRQMLTPMHVALSRPHPVSPRQHRHQLQQQRQRRRRQRQCWRLNIVAVGRSQSPAFRFEIGRVSNKWQVLTARSVYVPVWTAVLSHHR